MFADSLHNARIHATGVW